MGPSFALILLRPGSTGVYCTYQARQYDHTQVQYQDKWLGAKSLQRNRNREHGRGEPDGAGPGQAIPRPVTVRTCFSSTSLWIAAVHEGDRSIRNLLSPAGTKTQDDTKAGTACCMPACQRQRKPCKMLVVLPSVLNRCSRPMHRPRSAEVSVSGACDVSLAGAAVPVRAPPNPTSRPRRSIHPVHDRWLPCRLPLGPAALGED